MSQDMESVSCLPFGSAAVYAMFTCLASLLQCLSPSNWRFHSWHNRLASWRNIGSSENFVQGPCLTTWNTVPPVIAFPVATGLIKIHGDLMIVVYWISIKGFSPGRRVSTAIYGMIVVTMSDEGNGELEGFMVVGIYEGVAVGILLGDFSKIIVWIDMLLTIACWSVFNLTFCSPLP